MKPGEPLWLDEDRDYALALHSEELNSCGGCGHPLDEALDPRAEDEVWYEPTVYRCHACTRKAAAQRNYTDADAGLYIGVKRR